MGRFVKNPEIGRDGLGITIPNVTTALRPAGVNGQLIYNTTTSTYQSYIGSAWYNVSTAAGEKTITIDKEHNRSIFNSIGDSFGYNTPLPNGLVTDKNKIVGIIKYSTTTLGPLVLLNLLSARYLPDHPLKMVGQIAPDLFEIAIKIMPRTRA